MAAPLLLQCEGRAFGQVAKASLRNASFAFARRGSIDCFATLVIGRGRVFVVFERGRGP
jgi:hypothetical protein